METTHELALLGALVDARALRFRSGAAARVSRGDIAVPGAVAVPTPSQGTSLPVATRVLTP